MNDADNLSGRWLGIYSYPDGLGSVPFTADLIDSAGRLGGTIFEHDILEDGRALAAAIDGSRRGESIEFTKFYDGADPDSYDTVAYSGTVNADGTEISGYWDVPGEWSGSFIMTRPSKIAVPVATEAVEEVR